MASSNTTITPTPNEATPFSYASAVQTQLPPNAANIAPSLVKSITLDNEEAQARWNGRQD